MPGKDGFKYAYSPSQITNVLAKIPITGKPQKLTLAHLRDSWLLKDAQYSAVLDILKAMEFTSSDGTPTEIYSEYSNPAQSKAVLAKGIKKAYHQLFETYPNAHDLPQDTIEGFIKQHTGAEPSVVSKIYATFKRLCSLADFSATNVQNSKSGSTGTGSASHGGALEIPITMNIQIVIPNDGTPEQYDKIFTSIKKNLLNK